MVFVIGNEAEGMAGNIFGATSKICNNGELFSGDVLNVVRTRVIERAKPWWRIEGRAVLGLNGAFLLHTDRWARGDSMGWGGEYEGAW
jgi:hypothetical protein